MAQLQILDTNLDSLGIIEDYDSLIWKDCYNKYGDFELYIRFDSDLFALLKKDRYVWSSETDHLMVIEETEIDTNSESGMYLLVKGSSVESLLERRVIWKRTLINGSFQNGIQKLLNENAISPTDTNRKIPNLVFLASTDATITALTVKLQVTGENLYDQIQKMCADQGLGFKMCLNASNKIEFALFRGVDRSYSQDTRAYIVFSPEFDNLLSSKYKESYRPYKNVALVGGEGEGRAQKFYSVGTASGINRREIYVDASDISSQAEVEGDADLTIGEYNEQLKQRGKEKLADTIVTTTVEAEADTTTMFLYNRDFFLGDIVQLSNELGIGIAVRVSEVVYSQDLSKKTTIPTFEVV